MTKRLEKAQRGDLRLDYFSIHGALISIVADAEESTTRHAQFVARWQAAGSPADPDHPASSDLLAVHTEATYYRSQAARLMASLPAQVELAVARHYPEHAQCVVMAHARLARVERRPLRLPPALQASLDGDAVGPSEPRVGERRAEPRPGSERPVVPGTGRRACIDGPQSVTPFAHKAA